MLLPYGSPCPVEVIRIQSTWHRIKSRCHAKYHFLPNKFSSFSSNEEVDVLLGLQHLRGPLHTDHRSQPLGIVLGVEDSAGPGGFLSSGGGSQHVADFAVEVGICWQLIENQVPDAFYSVPVRRGERGHVYLRNVQESYLRDLQFIPAATCWNGKTRAPISDQRLHSLELKGLISVTTYLNS